MAAKIPDHRRPSPHDGDGQANSTTPAIRECGPWRTVSASVASLGTAMGIGVLHPMLGEVIAVIEVVVVVAIIGTALFGSLALSERAFRLLRWIGNRPEPPGPRPVTGLEQPNAQWRYRN
jgi:hypothetical protein